MLAAHARRDRPSPLRTDSPPYRRNLWDSGQMLDRSIDVIAMASSQALEGLELRFASITVANASSTSENHRKNVVACQMEHRWMTNELTWRQPESAMCRLAAQCRWYPL